MSAVMHTQPENRISVAHEVRWLIAQVEHGHAFDFEATGHAYDVTQEAIAFVGERLNGTALAGEIERRVEFFARSKGSAQMYLRLVVTDVAPDLPEYDPSEVVIFDGTNEGTNFSTANMRFTNLGTVMTSGDVTDLRAYFESGHKRILVAYLGTDRDADAKAHDKLLSALPGLLADAGMGAVSIKNVIEAIKAGNLPPAAMKILFQIIEIGQLKTALKTEPANAVLQARLEIAEQSIAALTSQKHVLSIMPPALVKALAVFLPQANPFKTSLSMRTSNSNQPAVRSIKELIQELRQTSKDKNLTVTQRREIAAVLRDLRAGTRITNPMPSRLVEGIVRLTNFVSRTIVQSKVPLSLERIVPRVVSTTLALAASPFLTALRPAFTSILRNAPLPTATRQMLSRVLEMPQNQTVARFVARHPEAVKAISPIVLASTLRNIRPADLAMPQPSIRAEIVLIDKKIAPKTEKRSIQVERHKTEPAPVIITAEVLNRNNDVPQAGKMPPGKPELGTAPEKLEIAPKQTPQEQPLQYNPDGTLKDCCKKPFNESLALQDALSNQPKITTAQNPSDTLHIVTNDGKLAPATVRHLTDNADAHAQIQAAPIQTLQNQPAITSGTAWTDNTLSLLNEATPAQTKVNPVFNQEGAVENRDINITFVSANLDISEKPSANRPRRTLRPA